MNLSSAAATLRARPPPSVAARFLFVGALLLGEKMLLNAFIDFHRALSVLDLSGFAHVVHFQGVPFLAAFVGAIALFSHARRGRQLKLIEASIGAAPIGARWLVTHGALIASLVPLSTVLYREGVTELLFAAIVACWLLLALAAVLSLALAMAPGSLWLGLARAIGANWLYAAIVALLGAAAIHLSQHLWEPTAALTFSLVRLLVSPVLPSLSADAAARALRTDNFAISITDECSGLEGMGLMLAFTAGWLYCFRREYFLPRALVLIPIGLAGIFALNVVRIALLLLLGNSGYEEVAIYGFHSQAGWIAFIAASCGVVLLSRRSRWLARTPLVAAAAAGNPTAVFLMPLVAILAAGVLSHAMSGRFEALYPLRLIAGVAALFMFRRPLLALDWRFTWRGPCVGAAVYVAWILAAHRLLPAATMPAQLAGLPVATRVMWIAGRVIASVVTVPIAEELAYRGYLMRRLSGGRFDTVPYACVRWPAWLVASIVFGLGHGALWLPGIAAGLAFGWILIRRASLGEAVAAHVTSNALVAVGVLGFDQWQLW